MNTIIAFTDAVIVQQYVRQRREHLGHQAT